MKVPCDKRLIFKNISDIPMLDLDRKLVVKGGGIRVEYRGSGKTFKVRFL